MRLMMGHLTQNAGLEDVLGGDVLRIPAPVVKDGEHAATLFGDGDRSACLFQRNSEGLINDNVLTGTQCRDGERAVAVVGRSDDYEIDFGMRGSSVKVRSS